MTQCALVTAVSCVLMLPSLRHVRLACLCALCAVGPAQSQQPASPGRLWTDVTREAIGTTADWTNKVEIADINGDGRPDLLFANGGNYSDPGTPVMNRAFVHTGPGFRFEDRSRQVFGDTPNLARVIKARDLNADGLIDIVVGTTYQT